MAANAVGGVKVCPQNKDISDNWPEWYEGLNNDFLAYASACNGEVSAATRSDCNFPQPDQKDRFEAREEYVLIRPKLIPSRLAGPTQWQCLQGRLYDMAYPQILWSQNETRLFPNPLGRYRHHPTSRLPRKGLFTNKVSAGGAGCADCHHNGNVFANGVLDDTFQDLISMSRSDQRDTVDGEGPFSRPENDYFFTEFEPPQDVGTPQNFSSRKPSTCARSGTRCRATTPRVRPHLPRGAADT